MIRVFCARDRIGLRFFSSDNLRRLPTAHVPSLASRMEALAASGGSSSSSSLTANMPKFDIESVNAVELQRIQDDPIAEQARHITKPEDALKHPGLPLLDSTEYPDSVIELHRAATTNILHLHFLENALFCRGVEKAQDNARILMREFARRDKVPLQFTLLHLMKKHNIPRDRLLYRSLMFACCKYEDTDWALYVLENMAHESLRDIPSLVRLFDAHTSGADRRAWHILDIIMMVAPNLSLLARANLATTAMLTAMAATAKLGRSTRAGRGFITLPNPRGSEWFNPWRHNVAGVPTYYEIDEDSGEFYLPEWYTAEQLELRDAMLEIEDGPRLKHYYNNTMSQSMREGMELLADVLGVDHAQLSFAPSTTPLAIETATDRATNNDSGSSSGSEVDASTKENNSAIVSTASNRAVQRSKRPLVDEKLVNHILAHIGNDKTRPKAWNDRPYATYKKLI